MSVFTVILKSEYQTILASGKTMDNRDTRKAQYAEAVLITKQKWKGSEQIEAITDEFSRQLLRKNSWGRNELLKELDIAIAQATNV